MFIAPVTENDTVIGSVILLEDITEAKALNRSKDEFFIIASHELRTPLTKIRGSAEIMRDVYRDHITSEEALKMLNEIEHSSGHLIDIVNDFIRITELEQGKIDIKSEDFNLTELARERTKAFEQSSHKDGVNVRVTNHGKETHVTSDKAIMTEVIDSLLSNAYKFTEQGEIVIEVMTEQDRAVVLVRDTGKGIKTENQSLLFHKFQQAGSSLLSRDGEGTGMGLYIAKLLVDCLGGEIGLRSSEEGKGSVFHVSLPTSAHLAQADSEH